MRARCCIDDYEQAPFACMKINSSEAEKACEAYGHSDNGWIWFFENDRMPSLKNMNKMKRMYGKCAIPQECLFEFEQLMKCYSEHEYN